MSKWLIPLLLGYSGGAAIYGHRGGVLGTIATAGVIAGSDIPMFLGAMIMGLWAAGSSRSSIRPSKTISRPVLRCW